MYSTSEPDVNTVRQLGCEENLRHSICFYVAFGFMIKLVQFTVVYLHDRILA